jgi:3-oxoacyl-[acyl-carrier-protein] synthase-3
MERVWVNVDRYGNTSSATIPVALREAREEGVVKDGSLVLMVAFGGGLTWGGTLLRW